MQRVKFTSLPRPFVCALVQQPTADDTMAMIHQSDYDGAHAIGVDVCFMKEEELTDEKLRAMMRCTTRPIYAMCYRREGDGRTDDDRAEMLKRMARAGASIVDVMGDFYDPQPTQLTQDEAAVARQRALIDELHALGCDVLMSSHVQVSMTGDEVYAHLHEFEKRGADVVKIVPFVNTREEMLESIRTTMMLSERLEKPFIHVTNGAFGRHQRIIAPMFGEMLTFGSLPARHTAEIAPHLPVNILRDIADDVYEHIDPAVGQPD